MHEDFERCYRAVQSKDPRFDGWFVTAVVTTRIYCRPSCPVRAPLARNVRFFPSAAAAQHAGFRACKRCRPDASPGSPAWSVRGDVVARAMRLIADGVIDREGVGGLAGQLGYSIRQLERHLVAEVGAGPLALARAQRAQTARLLIETTAMPLAGVAFAAGFSSVRQFNDTVRLVFAATPSDLRTRAAARVGSATAPRPPLPGGGALSFRLAVREPFEAGSVFGHLGASAVPGIEECRDGAYRRTLRLPHGFGIASLRPAAGHVACQLVLDDWRDVPAAIARCRGLLDLDADPEAIVDLLGGDPHVRPLVSAAPGRRIPRTVDGQELAIRAVLGQQVSTAAARTYTARLVAELGERVDDPAGGLTSVFPSVEVLAAEPTRIAHALRIPRTRQACLTTLIEALADGTIDVGPGADWDRVRERLLSLPGVGTWTADIIAMRGLGHPDVLPVADLGVRKAADQLGLPSRTSALAAHSTQWKPWRSYATQYLWAILDHPINRWPSGEPE